MGNCSPVNIVGQINSALNSVGYGLILSNTPQAIFSAADADCLLSTYPAIFSGYETYTVGDALTDANIAANDDEADHAFTAYEGQTASTGDALGYIMTMQPGVTQVVPLTFYNYPQNPTFTAGGEPEQAATGYTLSPQDQVIDPTQLVNLPGYGYITLSGNMNTAANTAAATQTAQATQYNAIQTYTDNVLEAQRENPGFFGSFAGFAILAAAIVALPFIASSFAAPALADSTATAASAGEATVDAAGNTFFANGVIWNPALNAWYLPEAAGGPGAWIDAATGEALTDSATASVASVAATGEDIASGQLEVIADAGQTSIVAPGAETVSDVSTVDAASSSATAASTAATTEPADIIASANADISGYVLPQAAIASPAASSLAASALPNTVIDTLVNNGFSLDTINTMLTASSVDDVTEIANSFSGPSASTIASNAASQIKEYAGDAKTVAALASSVPMLSKLLGISSSTPLTAAQQAAVSGALLQAQQSASLQNWLTWGIIGVVGYFAYKQFS